MYKSPFAASNTKITIKVTRKYYDRHPEKYEGFVYDTERGCDENEYFKILVNEEGEYLLVKENRD